MKNLAALVLSLAVSLPRSTGGSDERGHFSADIERARLAALFEPAHEPRAGETGFTIGAARWDRGAMHVPTAEAPLEIALVSLGRADACVRLERSEARVASPELHVERAEGVLEWWRSLDGALEHGVTIDERPSGEGPLVLEIAMGARTEAEGDGIRLAGASGRAIARYDALEVRDAAGALVPATMRPAADRVRIEIRDEDARYPLVVDPLVHAVLDETLEGTAVEDNYGGSVALSADGTRALVAHTGASGFVAGAVHVMVRVGPGWVEEAALVAPDATSGDTFGLSVALSADATRAAVGAPGDDTTAGANAGSVRTFVRSGTTWSPEATLEAAIGAANDALGERVAISADGRRIVASATGDDTAAGAESGSVRVFSLAGAVWTEDAVLVPSWGAAGQNFGFSVAISDDGTRVGGGTFRRDIAGRVNVGSVSMFVRGATAWVEEAALVPPVVITRMQFGTSIALDADGDRAAIGAFGDGLHVWARTGASWSEVAVAAGAPGSNVAMRDDGRLILASGRPPDATLVEEVAGSWSTLPGLLLGDASGRAPGTAGLALSGSGNRAIVGTVAEDVPGHASFFTIVATRATGATCTVGGECLSGSCADGVCCSSACGGGAPDDCEACTMALTGMPDGTCGALAAAVAGTVVCRAAAAASCDAEERCLAGVTACPPDALSAAGTVCRPPALGCDAPEICDGTSIDCPPDVGASPGAVCRPAAGGCDVPESCDGLSFACPGDAVASPGAVCRGVAGTCDLEERCTGGIDCPADAFVAAGTSCRESAGVCDVAESCTGASGACPGDTFAAAGTVCDPTVTGPCDAPDVCTGSTASCVPTFLDGVECRASLGACDPAEVCLGDTVGCPSDRVEAAGMICRDSTDPTCDPAESCDGVSSSCPANVGSCPDAGPSDAGGGSVGSDAGSSDGGPPVAVAGCGCRAGGTPGAGGLVALGTLALALGHRRRDAARTRRTPR